MKIIGGRDYYDSAMVYGQDPTIVFVRDKSPKISAENSMLGWPSIAVDPVKISGKDRWTGLRSMYNSMHTRHYEFVLKPIEVWFAGKRYAGMVVDSIQKHQARGPMPRLYFWHELKFREWAVQLGYKFKTENRSWRDDMSDDERLSIFFTNEGNSYQEEWLIENKIAIAMWFDPLYSPWDSKKKEWSINCTGLKEIEFAKRLSPTEAYQELSMYLSSTAPGAGRPMVEITDQEVKRDKAGFNEWSFKRRSKHDEG